MQRFVIMRQKSGKTQTNEEEKKNTPERNDSEWEKSRHNGKYFYINEIISRVGLFRCVCVCESERVCVCIRRWAACFSQASLWFYEYIAIVAYSVFFHFFSLIRSLALLCVNQAESTTVTIQFVLNLLYRIVVRGCKNIFLVVLFAAVALLCCTFVLTLDSSPLTLLTVLFSPVHWHAFNSATARRFRIFFGDLMQKIFTEKLFVRFLALRIVFLSFA